MDVALVGTGLIGGSLGLALRARGHRVVAFDLDPVRLDRARDLGVADAIATDLAAVVAHDAVGDAESQSGALAHAARREERVEDAGQIVGGDTGSAVDDRQRHGVGLGRHCGGERDRRGVAAGDRVLRIDHQIEQGLLQMRGIGPDGRQVGRHVDRAGDVVDLPVVRAERLDPLAHVAERRHRPLGALPAREGQQVPHDAGRSLRFPLNDPDPSTGQFVEQLGVHSRVAHPDIVDRVDDAPAHEVRPHQVDEVAGEVRILGRGEPFGRSRAFPHQEAHRC